MPSAFSISDAECNRVLQGGSGFQNGKLRIYALYQQEADSKVRTSYLKAEYGTGGRSYQFGDGTNGFVDYGSKGLKLRSYEHGTERRFGWSEVEKRIHTLIQADQYLTPPEKEGYAQLEQEYVGIGGVPLPEAGHAFPPAVAEEANTGPERADAMLKEAQKLAAESQLAPPERFTVVETEGGYGLWDDIREELYVDADGVSEEFESAWQAEDYRRQVIRQTEEQEAAE